jgi:hypothetical protein
VEQTQVNVVVGVGYAVIPDATPKQREKRREEAQAGKQEPKERRCDRPDKKCRSARRRCPVTEAAAKGDVEGSRCRGTEQCQGDHGEKRELK